MIEGGNVGIVGVAITGPAVSGCAFCGLFCWSTVVMDGRIVFSAEFTWG